MLNDDSYFSYGGTHPAFPEPAPEAKVWRYVTLAQLLALLGTRKLHFTRIDKFQDPFEGTHPLLDVQDRRTFEREYGLPERDLAQTLKEKRTFAATCWHLSEYESEAMWQLYAGDGVAIESTFGRFIKSLPTSDLAKVDGHDKAFIFAGRVTYIDYERGGLTPIANPDGPQRLNNGFIQVMHKRKSFEHEKEVRAVICAVDPAMGVGETGIPEHGVNIPIDLNELIQAIHISPAASRWFKEVVVDSVARYSISAVPRWSSLAAQPYG